VALDLKFVSEGAAKNGRNFKSATPEQDDLSLNHHLAPTSCSSMIFFRKPVPTFRDHAPKAPPHSGDYISLDPP
jgi:hypothetical protein